MRLLPRHSGLRPQFYILTLTAGPCTLSGVLHGAFRSCTYYAREATFFFVRTSASEQKIEKIPLKCDFFTQTPIKSRQNVFYGCFWQKKIIGPQF